MVEQQSTQDAELGAQYGLAHVYLLEDEHSDVAVECFNALVHARVTALNFGLARPLAGKVLFCLNLSLNRRDDAKLPWSRHEYGVLLQLAEIAEVLIQKQRRFLARCGVCAKRFLRMIND